MKNKITVLVVDDSAVVRQVLTGLLGQDSDIIVLGAVADPLFAMERMKRQWPDVILLDIEMPRMNGIAFLKKIMKEHPTPVVICSSHTEKGAAITMQALSAGAVDIITKPQVSADSFLVQAASDLIRMVKAAARANIKNLKLIDTSPRSTSPKLTADAVLTAPHRTDSPATERIIAIGASTGGTQAIESILAALPADAHERAVAQCA